MSTPNYRTALTVGAALSAFATAALAQTAPSNPASDPSTTVDDIVVTAQRRSERLQDVATAVSAFTGEQLTQSGVSTSKQLEQVTPGLFFTSGASSPQPTIRGIGSRGTNAGDESIVPVYIDGVYQPFMPGLIFDLAGVERVEVLKGPQGTLYGRNATGGAISIITETPSAVPTGSLSLSYGSRNAWRGDLYASGGSDTLAASLSLSVRDEDGFVKDVVRGGELGGRQSLVVRPKLLWTPNDRFDLTLSGNYLDQSDNSLLLYHPLNRNTIARRTVPTVYIPEPESYEGAYTDPPIGETTQHALSAVARLHFDGFDVVSLTGWQKNRARVRSDSDGTAAPIQFLDYTMKQESWNEEVYAISTGDGPVDWTVGFFYFNDDSRYDPYNSNNTSIVLGGSTTDSYAVYAEGTYHFTEAWSLTAGGRYTTEDRGKTASLNGGAPVTASTSFDRFTPTINLQYRPGRDLNVYLKYGEAFKSGVYQTQNTSVVPVEPEVVKTFELGVKSDPASWLRLNLATFYSEYTNIQATTRDPVTNATVLQNAAAATIYGIEGEAVIRPTDQLTLRIGGASTHAEFDEFRNAQSFVPAATGGNTAITIDASGLTLPKAPEYTFNLGAEYRISLPNGQEITLNGNAYRVGKFYWYADNRLSQEPYTLVNATARWDLGRGYAVSAYGENLFDERYTSALIMSAAGDLPIYSRPSTFGVRVEFNW